MKKAAGIALFRIGTSGPEVLLIHPSGNYNRKAPWGIPKGAIDGNETPEEAARRETWEETGVTAGDLVSLGTVTYRKSGKLIHGFGGPAPPDAAPHCASWEVDHAEFVGMEKALQIIHPDQKALLERLMEQFHLTQ